jgi:hypothetical protein
MTDFPAKLTDHEIDHIVDLIRHGKSSDVLAARAKIAALATAAPAAQGQEATVPASQVSRPYGMCSIVGPAEDVAFVFRHLPDVDDAPEPAAKRGRPPHLASQPALDLKDDGLRTLLRETSDHLAELYARYSVKIGPFASQSQKLNVRIRSALAAPAQAHDVPPERPDEAQLERWRSAADQLLRMDSRSMNAGTIRDAAFQLQNAYHSWQGVA